MKIAPSKFNKLIQKASLSGKIMTINLNFTEEGVKSNVRDVINVALTSTFLNKKSFEDYKPIGEIFIKHSEQLMKYLSTFKDSIELELLEDYILKISDENRAGYILLGSDKVCENLFQGKMPEIPTVTSIDIKKSDLSGAINDIKNLNINQITLEKKGNKLNLTVGEMGASDCFVNAIGLENTDESESRVQVNEYILSFLSAVDDVFNVKMGNDTPVVLYEKTDDIEYTCILAPVVEN